MTTDHTRKQAKTIEEPHDMTSKHSKATKRLSKLQASSKQAPSKVQASPKSTTKSKAKARPTQAQRSGPKSKTAARPQQEQKKTNLKLNTSTSPAPQDYSNFVYTFLCRRERQKNTKSSIKPS